FYFWCFLFLFFLYKVIVFLFFFFFFQAEDGIRDDLVTGVQTCALPIFGESDIGGPVMNIIPRSGGNQFAGTGFFSNAGKWSSGENLSSDIQALNPNLRPNPGVVSAYDWSASYGGPIKRDRLWFYGSYRDLSTSVPMDGILANANAGDPAR